MKPAHHAGSHKVNARKVCALAATNPLTLCWRCERPLDAHQPHADGQPVRWTGGHTIKGSATAQPWLTAMVSPTDCRTAASGDWLAPEASTCNYSDQPTNQRVVTTRRW